MTHRQIIDLRDAKPRTRPLSIWSQIPALGPVNTADAVADLYQRDEVEVMVR